VVVRCNENIREIMEQTRNIYVFGCEDQKKHDFIHYRNSGLNHILANIAKENKIKFLFNFAEFIKLDNHKRAIVLGRLKQNIMLYNKYKVGFEFASFASTQFQLKKDMIAIKRLLESNKQ
jgi:RNase P/RNase MRP subunit p30